MKQKLRMKLLYVPVQPANGRTMQVYGDSGGPLIVEYSREGNQKRWLQVGVTNKRAWASEGTVATLIYARVSSYADWIERTTKGAAVPLRVPATDAPDPEQLTIRLSQVEAQIASLETTVQSLESNRALLRQSLEELQKVAGQDVQLQTQEDGILNSVATILGE